MRGITYVKINTVLMTIVGLFLISGCIDLTEEKATTANTQNLNSIKSVGYIYHAEDGNRLVKGQGDLPNIVPVDIVLPDTIKWIVAAEDGLQSVWVAVLENGEVKAFIVSNQEFVEMFLLPSQINTAIPPTVIIENDGSVKLANVFDDGSIYTSPVILDKDTGDRVYIASNGDVVLKTSTTEKRLAVNALPYARVLLDDNKRILVLTDPTDRYDHLAVLGSSFKHASSITLIDTTTFTVSSKITLNAPDVVEGNALIWADVNNDGNDEIITTLSNSNGARIVIYNEDGSEYGESTAIGIDHRWRHQIAVAPFKSANETSLVSVYIPHLGPEIEYFRVDDKSMSITNEAVSYTSHLFTGLNIDMSITGDFDNDGTIELLLVSHASRYSLDPSIIGAYEYDASGIKLDWTLNLKDRISSNVAAVTLSNNTIAFGVGQGKHLRIWHP